MASGDQLLVWSPLNAEYPSSNYGQLTTRNARPCIAFDAATDERVFFSGVLPQQNTAAGVVVQLAWMAASATSGTVRWEISWERHDDEGTDLDADSFACMTPGTWAANTAYSVDDCVLGGSDTYQCTTAGTSGGSAPAWGGATVTDNTVTWTKVTITVRSAGATAPATSGAEQYTTINCSTSQMDGLQANEEFRLMVRRDANGTTGTDDMTGDAQLTSVQLRSL